MKPTLIIILERARAILKNALNRAIAETALPAYLIEGILLDLLAEVRAQKAAEIAAEHENALKLIPPQEPPAPASCAQEQTDSNTTIEEKQG